MEEILASIRRIIADDQSLPGRAVTPSAAPEDDQIRDRLQKEPVPEERVKPDRSKERPVLHATPPQAATADPVQTARATAAYQDDVAYGRVATAPDDALEDDLSHYVAAEQSDALYDTPIDPEPLRARGASRSQEAQQDDAALFSASTDAAVASAFNMLAASRLASSSDEIMTLAREMIRPLLRTWIDDNLPSMVERMVRAEIERVARGGR